MSGNLHPDIQKFKSFVKNRPYVLRDVKSKEKTLQDLYEEWALFGDDDPVWETYKEENPDAAAEASVTTEASASGDSSSAGTGSTAASILAMLKSMNMNDLQHQLAQFNGALTSIQELLGTFRQGGNNQGGQSNSSSSPFSFRDD
ncbi:spore coat protein YlbD [Alteribacter lacisalsi]|uniref:spore coat protein YlbD n=1 Tax=Alteribacter lacisalsi TaxID=2045244 RepID=UPI0013751079|nr:spore coat protein YlbD [Alteribacter lacisalsi]